MSDFDFSQYEPKRPQPSLPRSFYSEASKRYAEMLRLCQDSQNRLRDTLMRDGLADPHKVDGLLSSIFASVRRE